MEDRNLLFYGILDFYPNKEQIKESFQLLNYEKKKAYKRDVYSICFVKENIKDWIWEYLNDWTENIEKLENFYNQKKKRQEELDESYNTIETGQLTITIKK